MNLARLAALLLFIAAMFCAFGWFIGVRLDDAVGLIAAGLALEVLAGVPIVPVVK